MYILFTINIISNIFFIHEKYFLTNCYIYKKKNGRPVRYYSDIPVIIIFIPIIIDIVIILFFNQFALMDSLETTVLTNAKILVTVVTM